MNELHGIYIIIFVKWSLSMLIFGPTIAWAHFCTILQQKIHKNALLWRIKEHFYGPKAMHRNEAAKCREAHPARVAYSVILTDSQKALLRRVIC